MNQNFYEASKNPFYFRDKNIPYLYTLIGIWNSIYKIKKNNNKQTKKQLTNQKTTGIARLS